MSSKIIELKDVLSESDFEKLLVHTLQISEDEWKLLNQPELNGKFWNDKRAMIPYELITSLQEAIFGLGLNVTNFSAINKVQRYYQLDKLGPLKDTDHVDYLKVGIVYFLNAPFGAQITFPNMRYSVKAETNKLVAYPANETYEIHGPFYADDKLYFMTIFGD